jgi:nucleoid-associated protein YgaU
MVTDDPFNGEAAKLLVKETDVQIFRTGEVYTVKAGDSLSKIAKNVYPNNAHGLEMILENNKEVIGENHDLIHPGQKLFVSFNTH